MPKIMFSVGEASGDLHGANVAKAIKKVCPEAKLFGMGGQMMREAGVEIVYDIAGLGVIGLVEVIKNLPKFFKLRSFLADIMDKEKPDVLVIIDYPGFNMKLAKVAKNKNIPIVSYISPSAWAWGKGRAKEMAGLVNMVAAIFPFEAKVYEEAGANVTFVGHPLLDVVKPSMTKEESYEYFEASPDNPILMLMPGSREQEIENLLTPMVKSCENIAKVLPNCQFYLPVASTISLEMIESKISASSAKIRLTKADDKNYDLMNIADVAIASSGTATLELALLQVPSVIIYRVVPLTYYLGKILVKIPNIGLPNIIAGRKIMPELLQNQITVENITQEALKLLNNQEVKDKVLTDLEEVRQKLGNPGALERVAEVILSFAKK
ncbi:lipid-A-disaccharide synthase [Selenomonadales bacterium OttesenSCG-928-I06]|nr:lipid-A-disaccharide synthase [Selenomonadales bacterium OttesenSCG-928-I06]